MARSGVDRAALGRFKEKFDKNHGADALKPTKRVVTSTGSMALDYALGTGGLVQGRIYETWGPESAAKSTVNLLMAAEQQKAFSNRMVGWVDMEHTFDDDWAKAHGVDTNQLWVIKPNTAEEVADQVKDLMQSELFSFVVLDSVGGMIADKEFEKDAAEATVGLVAKVVTRMVKMSAVRGAQNGCTLSIVNQVRAAIGGYGADTTSGGGWALKHVTTAKIKMRQASGDPLKVGSGENLRVVGRQFAALIEKNKLAPPKTTATLTLFNQATDQYGPIGLDRAAEAFTMGKRLDLFVRSGAYYTLPDGERLLGEKEVVAHLREHPKKIDDLRDRALAKVSETVVSVEDEQKVEVGA